MDNDYDLYPMTVIKTRYGGIYEGGPWAALDCSFHEVPLAAVGSDIECAEFWSLAHAGSYEISDWRARIDAPEPGNLEPRRPLKVGVGDSPEAALAALRSGRSQP
jgi:hypothetical protein